MRSEINQIEMKHGAVYLEFSNCSRRFDIIVSYDEYIDIGKPMPGDAVEVSLLVTRRVTDGA